MPPTALLTLWLLARGAFPAPSGAAAARPDERATVEETIVVTAAREAQPLFDAVSFVTVLPRAELERSSAVVLDQDLSQIPGFSLFRRNSSLTAHPTTQGVSLRGIGPSGTSRSLVLFDGIPLNDPFGGWVYWSRVPRSAIETVEVSRGATSQLYGSSALGGTVQLRPREPSRDTLEVTLGLGAPAIRDIEVYAADTGARWGYSLAARAFRTGGFYLLRPEDRGAVDRRADLALETLYARFSLGRYHLGAQAYAERRTNGTGLQRNDSRIALLDGGFAGAHWEWNVYAQTQRLDSTFSRILADRSAEVLTAEQSFPADAVGGSLTWRDGRGLIVGGDWRRSAWQGTEQSLTGALAQKTFAPHPRLALLAGVRLDVWETRRRQTTVSPRLGAVFRATAAVTVRASLYRGFRAPTFNELYRPFRVGNVLTQANPELVAERLVGGEVGVDLHPPGGALLRANLFRNRLDGAVGNLTLEVTPELVRRQRANLGPSTIDGLELAARLPLGPARLALHLAYLYSDARQDATGTRLPQTPLHQATAGLDFRGPVDVTLGVRWTSAQFEDDRNQLPLAGGGTVDLTLGRRQGERWELVAAASNLLDRPLVAARLPEERLSEGRSVHLALRFRRR